MKKNSETRNKRNKELEVKEAKTKGINIITFDNYASG